MGTEEDASELKKAKNILALSVDSSVYVHIQTAKTALEIWTTFQRLYEDKGLARKIGLLRQLISIRLEESEGMENYIEKILNTSNKLSGIGFAISEEWLGAILLACLTEEFRPLIMEIESSGVEIKSDAIIYYKKLLDNKVEKHNENEKNAFRSKKMKRKFPKNKNRKCYLCGSSTHLAKTRIDNW